MRKSYRLLIPGWILILLFNIRSNCAGADSTHFLGLNWTFVNQLQDLGETSLRTGQKDTINNLITTYETFMGFTGYHGGNDFRSPFGKSIDTTWRGATHGSLMPVYGDLYRYSFGESMIFLTADSTVVDKLRN